MMQGLAITVRLSRAVAARIRRGCGWFTAGRAGCIVEAAPIALMLFIIAAAMAANAELGFSRSVTPGLMQEYSARFGEGARNRLKGWQTFIVNVRNQRELRNQDDLYALERANDYYNFQPYLLDIRHWGREDYWATPAEFLASNGGDCEDYAIAKYFALKEVGVPINRMRIVYVMASTRDRSQQAHMVLAYYPRPDATPLILDDSIHGRIEPATARPDLIPVYRFNDEDPRFQYANSNAGPRQTDVRQWNELVQRLELELQY